MIMPQSFNFEVKTPEKQGGIRAQKETARAVSRNLLPRRPNSFGTEVPQDALGGCPRHRSGTHLELPRRIFLSRKALNKKRPSESPDPVNFARRFRRQGQDYIKHEMCKGEVIFYFSQVIHILRVSPELYFLA